MRQHSRPRGNPPVMVSQVSGPGMDCYSCRGLKLLKVKPINNQSHNDASHYGGQHI